MIRRKKTSPNEKSDRLGPRPFERLQECLDPLLSGGCGRGRCRCRVDLAHPLCLRRGRGDYRHVIRGPGDPWSLVNPFTSARRPLCNRPTGHRNPTARQARADSCVLGARPYTWSRGRRHRPARPVVVVGACPGVRRRSVSCPSPCVLPLLPGYVSFISGERVIEATDGSEPRPIVPILLFIAGFTVVFTLLGAFASTFVPGVQRKHGAEGRWRGRDRARRADDRLRARARFDRACTRNADRSWPGAPGNRRGAAARHGVRAGWTPCIGPVLGSILAIAAVRKHGARHRAARELLDGAGGAVPVRGAGHHRGSWARSAGSSATTRRSPPSRARSWSPSVCCCSPASSPGSWRRSPSGSGWAL